MSENYGKLAEAYQAKKDKLRQSFVSKLESIESKKAYRKGAIVNTITDLNEEKEVIEKQLDEIKTLKEEV